MTIEKGRKNNHSSPRKACKIGLGIFILPVVIILSGCSILGDITYSVFEDQSSQLYDVQVLSAHSPYKVRWTTKLRSSGKRYNNGVPLVVIATGRYRNWSWKVQGSSSVVASWRIWLNHGAQQASGLSVNEKVSSLDWQHGFETLWKVTNYFLGENPLPARFTLTLIPNNAQYKHVVTTAGANAVQVVLSAWYPITKSTASAAQQKRFHYYSESLALAGGLLEKVEMANGVTAVPKVDDGQKIRTRVNAFCWRLAGRPAIAAGTNFKLSINRALSKSRGSTGGAAVSLTADMYEQHPDALLAQETYAINLAVHEASQYFAVQGLKPPRSGKDLSGINALLGFCHALIHYTGNIRTEPMPLENIKPAHVFPAQASATAARGSKANAG